jgi:predicted nucleic acid-binding protein
MPDKQKIFLDSNIVVYAYTNNEISKQQKAKQLFAQKYVVISTQVLQETANTLHKKFKTGFHIIGSLLEECIHNATTLHINTQKTILKACAIAERYQYSFYDSLIIAAALETKCQILYSEDLQNNMIIEGALTILNPFV